jgi:hypothetical protein
MIYLLASLLIICASLSLYTHSIMPSPLPPHPLPTSFLTVLPPRCDFLPHLLSTGGLRTTETMAHSSSAWPGTGASSCVCVRLCVCVCVCVCACVYVCASLIYLRTAKYHKTLINHTHTPLPLTVPAPTAPSTAVVALAAATSASPRSTAGPTTATWTRRGACCGPSSRSTGASCPGATS